MSESNLDQLATLVREALTSQATASFTAGRYSAGANVSDDERDAAADAAAAKAVELWSAFYQTAGELGDKINALRGVLARISVAAAKVGIELEGAELLDDDDDDDGCQGHESLAGANMGVTVYCDGSCVR